MITARYVVGTHSANHPDATEVLFSAARSLSEFNVARFTARDGSQRVEMALKDPPSTLSAEVEALGDSMSSLPEIARAIVQESVVALRFVAEYESVFELEIAARGIRLAAGLRASIDPDLYWQPIGPRWQAQSESPDYLGVGVTRIVLDPPTIAGIPLPSALQSMGKDGNAILLPDGTFVLASDPSRTVEVALQAQRLLGALPLRARAAELRRLNPVVRCETIGGNGRALVWFSRPLVRDLATIGAALEIEVSPEATALQESAWRRPP